MAGKVEGKLKTHLKTLDWEILKWSEIPEQELVKSPVFTFFPGEKMYISISKGNLQLRVFIDRLLQNHPFSLHAKVCLIDRHGQERLTETVNGTFNVFFPLAHWDLQEVNCPLRNEDQLIIRCTLSVESFTSEKYDCNSKVEESLLEETSSSNCLATLSTDFETLFKEETDTDCILKTVDGQFPVHRLVLSARSKVFAAMFHMSERHTGEVEIQDVQAVILGEVLHFAYTGKVRDLTRDNAVRLYAAADKYALHQLRDACLRFLMNNLEIENVCDAAVLAHTHAEEALEDKVVHFIVERFEEVTESEEWKSLLSKNYVLAGNLLSAVLLVLKNAGVRK